MRFVAIAAAALLAAGCGEKEEPAPAPPVTSTAAAEIPEDIEDAGREEVLEASGVPEDDENAEPEAAGDEATAAARRFVAALDERDGEAACRLLVPGALDDIELPRERERCASSLEASIGYEDPRGLPVWKSADVEAIVSTNVDGHQAKVVATVFTRFADRDEPSVEDDVIYLREVGGVWKIKQPPLTLYRAVGQEPPLSALATG